MRLVLILLSVILCLSLTMAKPKPKPKPKASPSPKAKAQFGLWPLWPGIPDYFPAGYYESLYPDYYYPYLNLNNRNLKQDKAF